MASKNTQYKTELLKRTYKVSLDTVRLVKHLAKDRKFDIVFEIIVKQLVRAVTSIGANVFEAQGAPTKKDFCNFISIALKSANESKFWFALLRDTNTTNETEISAL